MRNYLREAIIAAYKSVKGYKAISKQNRGFHSVVRRIRKIHKLKIFKTVANCQGSGSPAKLTSKSDTAMLREIPKKPKGYI